MKRMIDNPTETLNFKDFEVLTNVEMLKVRGGDSTPRTKDKDIFDDQGENQQ